MHVYFENLYTRTPTVGKISILSLAEKLDQSN